MSTILLSGYYGYNNIGDEAVLGGILAGLREELPEFTPVVLSGDPESTRRMHDVAAIPRMKLGAITAALQEAALFISGGGSLLQDVTSKRSPLYYLGVLWLAHRAGVPAMVLAQGLGPLNHPLNRLLARRILDGTRAITVRDAVSAEFLAGLGVSKPPIEVTADPSFLLQADRLRTPRRLVGRAYPRGSSGTRGGAAALGAREPGRTLYRHSRCDGGLCRGERRIPALSAHAV